MHQPTPGKGHTEGLNAVTPLLSQLSDAQFRQFVLKDVGVLAHAAIHRCAGALDAIAPYLGRLNPADLKTSFPGTISRIIAAAEAGHPWALINIAPVFQQLNRQEKNALDPDTKLLKLYNQHSGLASKPFCGFFSWGKHKTVPTPSLTHATGKACSLHAVVPS